MTGVITAVIRRTEGRNGGYGFIRDAENQERFFHARNLRGVTFDQLEEGAKVEFKPVVEGGKGNGLRAENVQVIR
jgi:cold shock CspA family protein